MNVYPPLSFKPIYSIKISIKNNHFFQHFKTKIPSLNFHQSADFFSHASFFCSSHLSIPDSQRFVFIKFTLYFRRKRNRDSRPSSPVQSDTEFEMRKIEQEGKERDEDKTHQQSWRWGELPSPPPESAHALNITTTSTQPNDSKSRKIFNIFHKRKKKSNECIVVSNSLPYSYGNSTIHNSCIQQCSNNNNKI